jgi:hypothetical protein
MAYRNVCILQQLYTASQPSSAQVLHIHCNTCVVSLAEHIPVIVLEQGTKRLLQNIVHHTFYKCVPCYFVSHDEELHNLYTSPNIITENETGGHVARMGEI